MRWVLRIGLAIAAVVLGLVLVIAVRTATYEAPAAAELADLRLAPGAPVDVAGAAERLAQAIRFRTISHQDATQNETAEWDRLHAWLQATYPAAHAAMTREVVAGHTLVYTWRGSQPDLDPIVLMAHQDVVPVTTGTEGDWRQPPFDGRIAEGAVWGRGAVDDKGSLVALLEAAEALSREGFAPRRTVIFVFGHDEEVGGTGAQAVNALFLERGIEAEFVLDEGMVVIADNPITGGPAAIIGVGEKGYATLQVTARAEGGHSSTPPEATGVTTLAQAVVAIAEAPFPMRFEGPGAAMVANLAAGADWPVRMAVANRWLFEPLLVSQIAATPPGAAMLHTTIAPTMLEGSPKENVLPQSATAVINYRIAPGQTSDDVMAHTRRAVGDLPVELSWLKTPNEPTPVSSTSGESWRVLAALAQDVSGAPVAPGLVLAGTDSRHMQASAKEVYRFQPIELSLAQTSMIHGTNEHMSLENLERMVLFYRRLISTAAG